MLNAFSVISFSVDLKCTCVSFRYLIEHNHCQNRILHYFNFTIIYKRNFNLWKLGVEIRFHNEDKLPGLNNLIESVYKQAYYLSRHYYVMNFIWPALYSTALEHTFYIWYACVGLIFVLVSVCIVIVQWPTKCQLILLISLETILLWAEKMFAQVIGFAPIFPHFSILR